MWYVVGFYESDRPIQSSGLGLRCVYVLRAGPSQTKEAAEFATRLLDKDKKLIVEGTRYHLLDHYVVRKGQLASFGLEMRGRDVGQFLLPGWRA